VRRTALGLVASLVVACAGPGPDGAGLVVRAGTGGPGRFDAPEGGVLRLQRGCQGAQHVFTSVRVEGAAPEEPFELRVTIHRKLDGALVSVPLVVKVPLEADPEVAGAVRATGLTPVVESPRDVLDEAAELRVEVLADDGREGRAVLEGVVKWGPDAC
jgi:hypothetical protein